MFDADNMIKSSNYFEMKIANVLDSHTLQILSI